MSPCYVHWSDEDNAWVATCPDFPSLSWVSASPADALWGFHDLLKREGLE